MMIKVLLYGYATGVCWSRKLARECGPVKLGRIAADGIKVKANASRHKAMSYKRMQEAQAQLQAQINALIEQVSQADAARGRSPDDDRRQ